MFKCHVKVPCIVRTNTFTTCITSHLSKIKSLDKAMWWRHTEKKQSYIKCVSFKDFLDECCTIIKMTETRTICSVQLTSINCRIENVSKCLNHVSIPSLTLTPQTNFGAQWGFCELFITLVKLIYPEEIRQFSCLSLLGRNY